MMRVTMPSANKHNVIVKFKKAIHPEILHSLKIDKRIEVVNEDEILIKDVLWYQDPLVENNGTWYCILVDQHGTHQRDDLSFSRETIYSIAVVL